MDTQGFDLEVIAGAEKVVGEIAGIRSEIAFQPLYENAPDHVEAFQRYQGLGFEVSGLFPTHYDAKSAALIEVECYFRRIQNKL